MRLTDVQCRTTPPRDKVRKLSDGHGLQLWISPTGSRHWRLAYRHGDRQKLLAIGPYPAVTLAEAREAAIAARKQIAAGVDPMAAKRQKQIEAQARSNTFQKIASEYLNKLRAEGRATATLKKIEWLLDLAYPDIGDRHIAEIKPADILVALRRVEARGNHESARRLRSTIGSVFRYGVATARAEYDPTTSLKGALIAPKATPRAAILEPKALGRLLHAVDAYEGHASVRTALQLIAILFPRPGELRRATWAEFDLKNRIWSIPAERMKMRRPHRSPLPKQAVTILAAHRKLYAASDLVFPGLRSPDRPISDNAMNAALRNMGFTKEQVVAHGFRATASTLLNECGKWNPDAIERQLAHIEQNDIRRAYARGEHWKERVKMMQWWADYLDRLKSQKSQA